MTNTAVYKMTQMNLRSSWVKWHRDLSGREEGWRNGGGREEEQKRRGAKETREKTARVIDLRETERTHTHRVGCYGWYDQLLLFCYFW